jgi:hypothetical protein
MQINTWPRQGGTAKRQTPLPEEMYYVETLVEPGNWYVTVLQDGKQIALIHKTFSADGKTMRQTITSIDAEGETIMQLRVFDRD